MLCDNCKKNKATIHYEQVINGVRTEKHLCAECAKKLNMGSIFDTTNIFAPLFSGTAATRKTKVCSTCGYTEQEFLDTQFLGCPDCYEAFSDVIEPMLRRVHGAVEHKGTKILPEEAPKPPKEVSEIDKLKAELDTAVKNEQYEKAAKLRDKIKELTNENK